MKDRIFNSQPPAIFIPIFWNYKLKCYYPKIGVKKWKIPTAKTENNGNTYAAIRNKKEPPR